MKVEFTKLTSRATTETPIYMSREQFEDAAYIPEEARIIIVDSEKKPTICQWCFEEPVLEGTTVCQACINAANEKQDDDFDLNKWLEEEDDRT